MTMTSSVSISIILCTRNRSVGLQQTLDSLAQVTVPGDRKAEVIVVDNASTDDTAAVVRGARIRNMEVRPLYEARRGKSHALNGALAQARGELILFTDDDVLVAPDWMEQTVTALADAETKVVTGRIDVAPGLLRGWQNSKHRWWLASSEDARLHEGSRELIGANMGIDREVLDRVSGFDPELGPGALGLAEDTLFGWQLVEAGFKITYASQATVVHCPDPSRLRRASWLDAARKHGRSEAYLIHHWTQEDLENPGRLWFWSWLTLQVMKVLHRRPPLDGEGCPWWEISRVWQMELCRQYYRERRRPRKYPRRGLVRIGR